jgi:hypothetical protein
MDADAFYEERDGLYLPTAKTVGPWGPLLQHGGPAAALLGSLLDENGAREGTRIAHFSMDFLGPVPVAPMSVSTKVLRPGKKIELSEAFVDVGGKHLLRAGAWRVTEEAERNPDVNLTSPVPPRPKDSASMFFPGVEDFGYAHALEWRFQEGGVDKLGPATVWSRLLTSVVAGKRVSPLARVLSMVDSANGVSAELPMRDYLFVPVNLTVSLWRTPIGEWFAMRAKTFLASSGGGMTRAWMFDERGPIGEAVQTLYVEKRAAA